MRVIFNFLLIIIFSISITGCSKNEAICGPLSSVTLIVYMGCDNNLSIEVERKIAAIQLFSRRNIKVRDRSVNILIYSDVLNESPKLYQCSYGSTEAVLLATYSQENSASPDVFRRVLTDCSGYAPADRYGLIVFSHASGWLPERTLSNPSRDIISRSVISDGNSEMDIKDFAAAIPNRMLDFILFEACFMAGVEVAYELKDKTNYIMASSAEMLSPGFMYIYNGIFSSLISGNDTKTSLIGAADIFFNHFNSNSGDMRSATISVINTSYLEKLAESIKALQPFRSSVDINKIQHFDRNKDHLFFDLDDYLTTATSVSLIQSIERVVEYGCTTDNFLISEGGFPIYKHCGLTTYIPQDRFPFLNQQYKQLKWYQAIQ